MREITDIIEIQSGLRKKKLSCYFSLFTCEWDSCNYHGTKLLLLQNVSF